MLNSDSGRSESNNNSSEESSTSEDLKALQQEDYMTSEDQCSPCQQGLQCEKEEEDDLYEIYSQFMELRINVINNDDVLDLLKNIKDLEVVDDLSPFKKITRKLQMKKGLISRSEAIELYMEEVKKDLMRNLDIEIKDDISMPSHTNDDYDNACIAGEGQDVESNEEIDIEALLRNYQQQIEESSSTNTAVKGKNKE
uniref:Uncharacterized protein n=1 Tax=Solanum tuberosum TaxID=4113 RepID=M1DSA0_SOLTU